MNAPEIATHINGTLQSFLEDHPMLEDETVKVIDAAVGADTFTVMVNGEAFEVTVRKVQK